MFTRYNQTFTGMFKKPRAVVESFIYSEKSDFMHPLLFMIINAILVILPAMFLVNVPIEIHSAADNSQEAQLEVLSSWMASVGLRASTQFLPLMMIMLLVPMLTIAGVFFFRNETDGFYSNLILNSYLTGSVIPVLWAAIFVWIYTGEAIINPQISTAVPGILIAVTGVWIYKNYFDITDFPGWIRIISSFTAGYVAFLFMKGIAAGVIGYMIFAINRIMEIQS